MPTSLTYIALETRGCAPRRPAAEIRYEPARRSSSPSLGFSRTATARRTPRRQRPCGALFATSSLSRGNRLSGSSRLRQKRQLFPAAMAVSPSLFGSPRRPPEEDLLWTRSRPGAGICTGFPFARTGGAEVFPALATSLQQVGKKSHPFPRSALQTLVCRLVGTCPSDDQNCHRA